MRKGLGARGVGTGGVGLFVGARDWQADTLDHSTSNGHDNHRMVGLFPPFTTTRQSPHRVVLRIFHPPKK